MPIFNEKDLGDALNKDQETIEIEGDLVKKVFRIKATGKLAWAVALGAIAVAGTAVLLAPTPEPTTKALGPIAGGAAIGILGISATTAAISISIATGGIGALRKLRAYKIISHNDGKIILKKP